MTSIRFRRKRWNSVKLLMMDSIIDLYVISKSSISQIKADFFGMTGGKPSTYPRCGGIVILFRSRPLKVLIALSQPSITCPTPHLNRNGMPSKCSREDMTMLSGVSTATV
mmetsp:Transcript_2371/g.3290  ORF Transcript_2371/g.3290 Transcript_2371/m.3290 type:complete len:110 (-) Transcript_2371:1331-1660(-)